MVNYKTKSFNMQSQHMTAQTASDKYTEYQKITNIILQYNYHSNTRSTGTAVISECHILHQISE